MAAGALGLIGAPALFPAAAEPRREPENVPTRLRLAAAQAVQGQRPSPNPVIPNAVPIHSGAALFLLQLSFRAVLIL